MKSENFKGFLAQPGWVTSFPINNPIIKYVFSEDKDVRSRLILKSLLFIAFFLKQVGVHQPKRLENANILIANTPMDTDKIKVFGSTIKVDSMAKIAELEVAEKEKMKDKVNKILGHKCNVFINRFVVLIYFRDSN